MNTLEDYQDILRRELIRRSSRNPTYSLRAFARDLDLEPTRLSAILNKKKGLSRAAASQLAIRLGLNAQEKVYFCDLVDKQHARSKVVRKIAELKLTQYAQTQQSTHVLTLDAFRVVSEWYHFAILQLLKIPSQSDEPKAIASALKIQITQAKDALERLQRLELLTKENRRLKPTTSSVASPDGIPSEAIRNFHEEILNKAITALNEQNLNERDMSAELLPIAVRDIEGAKKMIRKFRREFVNSISQSDSADHVYCLSVQFFNLSKGKSA